MVLSKLIWFIIGVITGLLLAPALIVGAFMFFAVWLLWPAWLPVAAIIVGAVLIAIGVTALLIK